MSRFAIIAFLTYFLTACGGGGGAAIDVDTTGAPKAKQSIENVQTPFEAASKAISKAKQTLTTGKRGSNAELVQTLNEAQVALQEVAAQQKNLGVQFQVLGQLTVQLENQKRSLEVEKSVLEKDKKDLEFRERLFSMGFYASFTTALIAVFGALSRIPTLKLDRKYRALEIIEKRIAIKEQLRSSRRDYSESANGGAEQVQKGSATQ